MFTNARNKIKLIAFKSNTNYFKKLNSGDIIVAIILCSIIIFLVASILRVWNSARNNYEIFNSEIAGLQELKDTNQQLKDELEYVSSDEYKELFLKNVEGLAQDNEELYQRRQTIDPTQEQEKYLTLDSKTDYSDWWSGLLMW